MYKVLKQRLLDYKSIERAFGLVVAIIVAVYTFVYAFEGTDYTPAPQSYIDALEQRIKAVESNPSIMFDNTGEISIEKNRIVYKTDNGECKVVAYFDREYNLLDYSIQDRAISVAAGVIIGLFVAFMMFALFLFVVPFVMVLLSGLYFIFFKDYKEIDE